MSKVAHSAPTSPGPAPAAARLAGPRRTRGAGPRPRSGTRAAAGAGTGPAHRGRRAEGRRQLDPERVGARPERLDRGQEGAHRLVGVGQPPLVGDRLRQLEHEPEVRGGLLGPRAHRVRETASRRRWCCPRRRCTRSRRRKPLARRQRVRQETALPGGVASTSRSRRGASWPRGYRSRGRENLVLSRRPAATVRSWT